MEISGLSYSIAIRTLGTAGEKYTRLLQSIERQTIQPERVLVYIAHGYPRPALQVGREEYIYVRKGMAAQRLLRYDEVSTPYLMLLDDDVELAPDSAERLLRVLTEHHADCVGADTFQNHLLPLREKLFAAVTNLVRPHWDGRWAFKIHKSGTFSYIAKPTRDFYWSQSCAGPASLWRTDAFRSLDVADELWIDDLGFPYDEDMLLFYKLYVRGGKLGILFNSGIKHLDGQSSSSAFRKGPERLYVRAKASAMLWRRCILQPGKNKMMPVLAFACKWAWVSLLMAGYSLVCLNPSIFTKHIKGLRHGLLAQIPQNSFTRENS